MHPPTLLTDKSEVLGETIPPAALHMSVKLQLKELDKKYAVEPGRSKLVN